MDYVVNTTASTIFSSRYLGEGVIQGPPAISYDLLDSLQTRNKTYMNVHELKWDSASKVDNIYALKDCYIDEEYGIVKYTTNDDQSWELVPK